MVNLENFGIPLLCLNADKYGEYSYSSHIMMITEEDLGFPQMSQFPAGRMFEDGVYSAILCPQPRTGV